MEWINLFAGAGGRFGPFLPVWAGVFAIAVLVEGLVRLIIAVSSGEPVGCLILALSGLRLKAEPRENVMADEYTRAGDFLNVLAPTRKTWWERAGGVTYRGEPFTLADFEKRDRGSSTGSAKGEAAFRKRIRSASPTGIFPRTGPTPWPRSGAFFPPVTSGRSNFSAAITLDRTSFSRSPSIFFCPGR